MGCQSLKISLNTTTQPSFWVFKTHIYSIEKQKSVSGYAHIAYMSKDKVRMDLYGPLGLVHAGTLVYEEGNFQALLPLEKKFLFGSAHSPALQRILKIPIKPQMLTSIIFQRPIEQEGWSCSFNEHKESVKECLNENLKAHISWKTFPKAKREILITSPKGKLKLKLKKSKYIPPLDDQKFKLTTPKSYKKISF